MRVELAQTVLQARKEQPVLYEQYASRGIVDKRLLQSFWAGRTYHQELEVRVHWLACMLRGASVGMGSPGCGCRC